MLPTREQARKDVPTGLRSVALRAGLVGVLLPALVMILAGGMLPLWAQSSSPALPAAGVVITEDSRLNMRQGPGIDFPLVIKLDPQTAVTVISISDDGGWYEIEVDGVGSGWVAAEWVALDTATAATDSATGAATDGETDDGIALILIPTPTPNPTQNATEVAEPDDIPAPPRLGIAALIAPTEVANPSATVTADGPDDETSNDAADVDGAGTATPAATTAPTVAVESVTTPVSTLDVISDTVTSTLTETGTLSPTASITESSTVSGTASITPTVVATNTVTSGSATTDAESRSTVTPESTEEASDDPTALPTATPLPEPDVPTAITQPTRMNVRGGPGTNFAVVGGVNANTPLTILGTNPARDWYRVEFDGLAEGEQAWVFASLTSVVGPDELIEVVPEEELPVAPTPEPQAIQASAASAPVVAAPPPAGGGFFGYGVQAHMLGGGVGEAMNATGDMGFNWIKQQVEWRLFQPSPGAIGFGELGGIVSAAGQRNINVLFSVVNAPEWAREPGFDGNVGGPPADPSTYAAFVGRMAGDFCGTALKAIEIWNEQNLHYEWGNKPLDPAEYMNLLRAAYGSIKAACPEMLVISGALTPAGSNPPFAMDDFAYLEGMYQNGLAAVSDGIGAHPSGYNVPASVGFEQACGVIQQTGNLFNGACDTPHHSWSFRSTMEGYRNIMVVYGDANKRIWPTEFGWAAGGAFDPRYAYANDNSFDEQAAWTVEAYTMMRNWGWVGPAFLWNLNFRVVADGTEKAQWGIVRNDYSPLPIYDALRSMPK